MCVWFGKPHPWWVRLCRLFALEGTKATSTCTLPLHLQNMCRRAHTFHVGSLSLSKSLFLPLLTHSIGKIRLPSASSQELFSPEKVSWRKTSSHLAPLRHLWPSGSCDKCMCAWLYLTGIMLGPLFHCLSHSKPCTLHYICQHKPVSPLSFVNEINRRSYRIPILSLHICRNNRQQMGNMIFYWVRMTWHTHTYTDTLTTRNKNIKIITPINRLDLCMCVC